MDEIYLNITTLDDFKDIIQDPEIKLIREKPVPSEDFYALPPDAANLIVSFLLGIPASMIATFLMERIKRFIKKTGNKVIIQGHSVQIELDPDSTDVDFENAVLKITPKKNDSPDSTVSGTDRKK